MVDYQEQGTISVENMLKKAKEEYCPAENNGNAYIKERREIISQIDNPTLIGFTLKEFIDFLSEVYKRFGNMPVLQFNGESLCFTTFQLSDIDIVKKYFLVSSNAKQTFINLKDEKALTIFTM